MNYEEAMEYIKSTYKFGSNYGTERTKKYWRFWEILKIK